jgi:hypothetical protein
VVKQFKGLDQQGRHPEAAHAASEIEEPDFYSRQYMLEEVGKFVVWTVVVAAVIVVVALLAKGFV